MIKINNMNELSLEESKSKIKNEVDELLKNYSSSIIRTQLINKGYSEELVDQSIKENLKKRKNLILKNSNIVLFKDFFDKIGFGFSSPLLIFAILYTINPQPLLIGVVVAIKSFIMLMSSSFIKEYDERFNFNPKKIATYGTIFGILFLVLGFAKRINSELIYTLGILISTFFMVLHGDLYSKYVAQKLIKSRSHKSIRFVSYFGLIITGLAFIVSGYLLDFNNITLNFGFILINIPGYLLVFEIIAFAFIFSSYAFSFVHPEVLENKRDLKEQSEKKKKFFILFFSELKTKFKVFFNNTNIKLIFYGTLFSGSLQSLITVFSGIYLYSQFLNTGKAFFYLSIIFGFGILAATIAPTIARKLIRIFGKTPMLVFGVFLISIFPLSIYLNVSFYALIIANAISVIGSSTLAIVQSFIINNTLSETERTTYFSAINPIIALIVPFIILAFSIMIQIVGIHKSLLILGVSNLVLVVPFYFSFVLRSQKLHQLKNKG